MYAEFVHPYNVRLARYFCNQTVYYHGCEKLDHKLEVLATLPNLRRFHVSPWSSVEAAREKFRGNRAAEGVSFDINLSDIHSLNGDPRLLIRWTEAAQEAACR